MVPTPLLRPVPSRTPWLGWAGIRAVLLGVSVVVLLVAWLWGVRSATLDDLRSDVAAGRVTTVEVAGGLSPGAVGDAVQEVRWRADGWERRTQVRWTAGPPDATGTWSGEDAPPVVDQDVATLVRTWDSDVRVDRRGYPTGVTWSADVLGVTVPGPVAVLVLVQGLGGLLVIVGGPDPRRATRWGWFWLSTLPLGMTAFLLLSGPLPGRPPAAVGTRRLRGGWAFVVAALLGGVSGGLNAL